MRLRRAAPTTRRSTTSNNGHSHEEAFTKIIEKKGTLDESLLLQESYAPGIKGKLMPEAGGDQGPARARSRPRSAASRTGKMRSLPKLIPGVHPKLPGDAQDHVKRIYAHAEEHRRASSTSTSPARRTSSRSPTRSELEPSPRSSPEPDERDG